MSDFVRFKSSKVGNVHDGPWLIPLADRLRMMRATQYRVAFLAEFPNASTFRYRCYSIACALNSPETGMSGTWFYRDELELVRELLPQLTTLVISRFRFTKQLEVIIQLAQKMGIRVIFDCDDLVFDPSVIDVLMQSVDAFSSDAEDGERKLDDWFSYVGRLHQVARIADSMTVTTRALEHHARKLFDKPSVVIKNVAGPDQVNRSRRIRALRDHSEKRSLVFGYFSGSPSHNRDFALIVDSLSSLFRREPRAQLMIVGMLDLPDWFANRFADRLTRLPMMNYLDLVDAIAGIDFNLAPLQTNVFTECKSELKFFDAALVGVPTIATRFGSIAEAVADSDVCLLTDNDRWSVALESACELSRMERIQLGERAVAFAEDRFTLPAITEDVRRSFSA